MSSGCKWKCLCGHFWLSLHLQWRCLWSISLLDIKQESTQPCFFRGLQYDVCKCRSGRKITEEVPPRIVIVVGVCRRVMWCPTSLSWICLCLMRSWIFSTWTRRVWYNFLVFRSDSTKSVTSRFPSINVCQVFCNAKDIF